MAPNFNINVPDIWEMKSSSFMFQWSKNSLWNQTDLAQPPVSPPVSHVTCTSYFLSPTFHLPISKGTEHLTFRVVVRVMWDNPYKRAEKFPNIEEITTNVLLFFFVSTLLCMSILQLIKWKILANFYQIFCLEYKM